MTDSDSINPTSTIELYPNKGIVAVMYWCCVAALPAQLLYALWHQAYGPGLWGLNRLDIITGTYIESWMAYADTGILAGLLVLWLSRKINGPQFFVAIQCFWYLVVALSFLHVWRFFTAGFIFPLPAEQSGYTGDATIISFGFKLGLLFKFMLLDLIATIVVWFAVKWNATRMRRFIAVKLIAIPLEMLALYFVLYAPLFVNV